MPDGNSRPAFHLHGEAKVVDANLKKHSKAPLGLLPAKPLRAIAGAMLNGAKKYKAWNWTTRSKKTRRVYTDALLRHVTAFADPTESDRDADSGLHHLAHAGANLLILLWHEDVDFDAATTQEGIKPE